RRTSNLRPHWPACPRASPLAVRDGRRLIAGSDAELREDLRDVVLRAVERDAEALGDLFVREIAPQKLKHLALAVSQLVKFPPAHSESIFAPRRNRRTTRKSA